jgi:N-dimethylarginine dimethylaminohydrolase
VSLAQQDLLVQSQPLGWGHRYVMVRPDHFRIDYAINPYMDLADQPDPHRAMAQWVDLLATIERLGGTVEVVPQRADAPDMVYAMNLGLAVARRRGDGGLEAWGFEVELVDVSEFHKGGGSVRCLSNPVDITLGRDVPMVPGGEVVVPPLD